MNRAFGMPRHQHYARSATALALSSAVVAGMVTTASPAAAATNHTIIAHRGDRSSAPENTLAAFGSAIKKGAEVIELDVQFSRTGYPVVIHDFTLDRTTDCTGNVARKSVTQLHRCDAGSWFGRSFRGAKIPTLWEALKYIHRKSSTTKVILHMKVTPTKKQAKITMQRVTKNHLLDRTIVMASTTTAMGRMRHAGAKKRAWIFNSSAGWEHKYQIMVPYETKVDPREVAAARKRGAVVWTVEGHPLSATAVLGLTTPVQGIMLNHMTPSLIDRLNGLVHDVTRTLGAESLVPAAPAPAEVATPVVVSSVDGAEDETTSPAGG
jgi:glycerophosphoryl diester phosphodiesterase